MAENHVLLETIELTQNAASVTFDNIPQTGYTDLKIVASLRGNGAQNWGNITINGGSTAVSMLHLLNNSGSVISQSYSPLRFQTVGTTGTTGNTFSNAELYIPNYTSSNPKSMSMDGTQESNVSGVGQHIAAGLWNNSSAITSVTVTPDGGGNFVAGSTLSLYGIAAVGTTPASAPKATGGNIVATDGTYWYHAFISTGTFTPQTSLSCDVLTIAGGGGGSAGGGGAGGLLHSSSNSLTATSYTVTIGAGGAGNGSDLNAFQGSNSQFGALTAAVGGGFGAGGAVGAVTGGNGGSGGGAGAAQGSTTVTASGGTGSQGFNGGSLSSASRAGAGGGGAGQVGANGSTNTGGAGGNGLNTYSSWGSATSTGVSGYYAGGGGGTSTSSGTAAGGLGGGGTGGGDTVEATVGTINTGSGGGGSRTVGAGKAGGSGIVIIRYAV